MLLKFSALFSCIVLLSASCNTVKTITAHAEYKIDTLINIPVGGVSIDKKDNVYVIHRGGRVWNKKYIDAREPVNSTVILKYSKEGKLIDSLGANVFILTHMVSIDCKKNIWVTDVGLQQVVKLDNNGKFLLSLGERFKPGSDTLHFDLPTDMVFLNDNSFFVSDGYGNSRIIKFSKKGSWQFSFGKKGTENGNFNVPHSIALHKTKLFVADRENFRLQIFDLKGNYISQLSMKDKVGRPSGVAVDRIGNVYLTGDLGTLMLSPDLQEIKSWSQKGHDIAVDSRGIIYIVGSNGFQKISPIKGNN